MTTAILISIISTIGLIFSLGKTGIFQKIITVGLAISVLMTWTGDKYIFLASILLQLILAIISTVYALTIRELNIIERITIGTTGLLLTLGSLTIIQQWPGQKELRLTLTVPIILFLWTTFKHGRQQPKEFGFMLIWMTIAAVQLTKYIMK